MTKETSEHRLWHMRQLVRSVGGTNEAARITGKRNSYITQIAGPKPTRQIGDKLAAQIELAFGLPSGSLDATPPAEHLIKEDGILGQITATLTNAAPADKEFVLAMSEWLVKRSLKGSATTAGTISAKDI